MRTIRSVLVILLLGPVAGLWAQERRPVSEVSVDALMADTQRTNSDHDFALAWWIPPEFWQISLTQDGTLNPAAVAQVVDAFHGTSILGVVQASVSPFGAFTFFDKEQVLDGLTVSYRREGDSSSRLQVVRSPDPNLELLLIQMAPVLTAAMGNMGENFHFIVFDDTDEAGQRIVSPYESGEIRAELSWRGSAPTELAVELPLDSLFVPRICPNGKPAHVSWNYCPWDGTALDR